jgi:hypothetical protein
MNTRTEECQKAPYTPPTLQKREELKAITGQETFIILSTGEIVQV